MNKLPSSFLILTIVIWHSSQFPCHNHSFISKNFIDPSQGDNEWPKWLFIRENESDVTQLFPTLCNPMDCTLPSSSIHGILQARILEWDLPNPGIEPRSPELLADSLPSEPLRLLYLFIYKRWIVNLVLFDFHQLKKKTQLATSNYSLPSNSYILMYMMGFPGGSVGKESACNVRWAGSLGQEDPLEEEMATHSSVLAWNIPWTEELDRVQSTGL